MIKKSILECLYNQPNPLIQGLGDLKESYAMTQSFLIKSLLREAEELILLRIGDVEFLRKRMDSVINPTQEERCFMEKLRKLID